MARVEGSTLQAGRTVRRGVLEAQLVGRLGHAGGASTLVIASRLGQPRLPGFLPGQRISLLHQQGDLVTAAGHFALHGAPGDHWHAYVPPERQHEVAALRVGDELEVGLPGGGPQVDIGSRDALVLVSSGEGAASSLGVLVQLAAANPVRYVQVLHQDVAAWGSPLADELVAQCAQLPWCTTHFWFDDGYRAGARHSPMLLGDQYLPLRGDYHLFGPREFVAGTAEQLLARGVPGHRLHLPGHP